MRITATILTLSLAVPAAGQQAPLKGKELRATLLQTNHGGGSMLFFTEDAQKDPGRIARELVPLLRDPEVDVRVRAATVLTRLPLPTDKTEKRPRPIIIDLAANSKQLLENLRANLHDKNDLVRWTAAEALVATRSDAGAEGITLLVRWLVEKPGPHNVALPFEVANGSQGQTLAADPERAAPIIFAAVAAASPDGRERLAGAMALWPIDALRPALAGALRSDAAALRRFALRVVGARGALRFDHRSIVVALRSEFDAALADADPGVRIEAAGLMRGVPGVSAGRLAGVLAGALADKDAAIRLRVVDLLRVQVEPRPAVVAALTRALADADARVRLHAAESLVANDPGAGAAVVPVVRELLKTPDAATTAEALRLVIRMGGAARGLVPELVALTDERGAAHRLLAAEALLHADPKQTAPAARAAGEALAASKASPPTQAVAVLQLLGPAAEPLLPAMARAFDAEKKTARKVALAAAIVGARPEAPSAAATYVRNRLLSEDAEAAVDVLYVLEGMGPRAKVFVPDLILVLKTRKEGGVLAEAANALGEIGPDARVALPLLEPLLKHPSRTVRSEAKNAIEQIQGK